MNVFLTCLGLTLLLSIPVSVQAGVKAEVTSEVQWDLLAQLVVPTYEESKKGKKPITNKKLSSVLDKNVVIKGFMMPLDFSAKEVSEFLLMPYVPSCMHVPPPPSNNLIVVKMAAGSKMKATFYPVEVTGLLKLDENVEYESSYQMNATKVSELDPKRMNEDEKKKLETSTPAVNHNGGL